MEKEYLEMQRIFLGVLAGINHGDKFDIKIDEEGIVSIKNLTADTEDGFTMIENK